MVGDAAEGFGPEDSYPYPPELLTLLTDAIAVICRPKMAVVLFFRSAGVKPSILADWEEKVRVDRQGVRKTEIAQSVLLRLNELKTDEALRQRREVLKRVVGIEDFSIAYPDDQLKAEALVARIRKVYRQKDFLTKVKQERDDARQEKSREYLARVEAGRRKREEREQIKARLYALFGETDHWKRGKALEPVLNDLFRSYEILVRESFTRSGSAGEGILEQIDGVIELDGHVYIVEMKWCSDPIGRAEVAQHVSRVRGRAGVGGLFISASPYTGPALDALREELRDRVHVALQLHDIVFALEQQTDLRELLRRRIRSAMLDKDPLV